MTYVELALEMPELGIQLGVVICHCAYEKLCDGQRQSHSALC